MAKSARQRRVTFLGKCLTALISSDSSLTLGPLRSQARPKALKVCLQQLSEINRGRRRCAAAAPTLSMRRVRRCKAAQGYAAYFVEHTSLNASTICSLYECL